METEKIIIRLPKEDLKRFFGLLESGVQVPLGEAKTITELAVNQLDIHRTYLKQDIQTIFLNGRPVDDPDTACISDADRIAFSASMPGLLGATMRKGGFYRALRQSISYCPTESTRAQSGDQWAVVKCFNQIARELGPHLLGRGLWLETQVFKPYLQRRILPLTLSGTWQATGDRSGKLSTLPENLSDQRQRYWISISGT